jgi:outer membrane lipoprotein-sorting protein
MKSVSALASCLLALSLVSAQAGAESTPSAPDLYHRMIALNAKLKTYTANVHLDVALKTFPYISPSLTGNVYYRQPNKEAVVFDTVPALASQFKKVYPRVDAPVDWPKIYDVTPLSDDSGTTTFRLIPKKNGRVEHLDVKVDDANATIKAYAWTYKDGGSVAFEQTFKTVDGNFLVDKQTGKVDLPSYKADVTSAFSNYKLNVAVADSVFDEK